MELSEIKNKVKHYFLIKNAGKYYVDESSEIIKELNTQGKKALFGIQNEKGYTIIGEKVIYYKTFLEKESEILHKDFTDELHENACRIGKGYLRMKFSYKNIILKNKDKVWLHNGNTMFSLWNTTLWLAKEERRRLFREKNGNASG